MKLSTIFLTAAISLAFSMNGYTQTKTTVQKKNSPTSNNTVKKTPAKPVDEIPGKIKVKITTDMGDIVVRLYDATPKHRDNFVKLVEKGFYDSLLFHRIIQGFMIQGGDPMSKIAEPGAMLGMGGGDMERIPAEFNQNIIHKKGALAAARDGNPEKASSACQFYIVQGNITPEEQLDMMSKQKGYVYTPEQKNIYKTIGGTPFLDMEYTVFGEVVSGLNVVDKIAAADKDGSDRPKKDIHMKMQLIK
jgi:peptidyl-prolyl cis-trans isomerase B (cyclophilin B)